MRVAAVILAAGGSTRLGRPKQELRFRGETLLARAVRIASEAADDTYVVTSRHFGVRPSFGARIVVNENAEEGIGASIRAGVASVPDDARILLMLVDQPLVTPDHLRSLIAVDASIVATGYDGVAGVPAVFAPLHRPALLALGGDRGARAVIESEGARVAVVPFAEAAFDVDSEEDAERLAGL